MTTDHHILYSAQLREDGSASAKHNQPRKPPPQLRPPRLMLTPLDRALCTLLATLGYLRTDQVVAARHQLARQQGLPVAHKEAAALRSVQRRLRQLVDGRILRRIRQPVFAGEGSKPYVYALDRVGAEVASAETGLGLQALDWKPKEPAPGGHPSLLFLDHTLAIGDFYLGGRERFA